MKTKVQSMHMQKGSNNYYSKLKTHPHLFYY